MAFEPVRIAAAIAPERGGHAARLATRRMSRGDVPDLVPEHTGELGFGIEVHQQAAIHIDIAAAGGERVDGLVVDDEELEFFVRQIARQRDALPTMFTYSCVAWSSYRPSALTISW